MLENRKFLKLDPLTSIIALVLFCLLTYFIIKGLWSFASWAMPVLAIATLLIDYTVYVKYGNFLINNFKKHPITGIAWILLTLAGFPLVILFLFGKSLVTRFVKKKIKEAKMEHERRPENQYLDYEEVRDEEPTIIELPPIKEKRKEDNHYDDFFS